MKKLLYILLLAVASVLGINCGSSPEQGSGAAARPTAPPLESMGGQHPRLLLTEAKIAELKSQLTITHRWLWDRYQREIPSIVAAARSTEEPEDVRSLGDLAPRLAFAWLMTGEDSLYDAARDHLLRLTDPQSWDAPGSLIYLIGSHFLMGISLSYDWLYPRLTPAERRQVEECLGREAQVQYESIVSGRIWWRNQYFQNHSHSNICGLAFSAAALWETDPRAADWMTECEKFFDKLFEVLPADGSSLEGYAYAGYGAEYILKYAAMSSQLLGKDYSGSPWMQNLSSYLVQGLLPQRTGRVWAMTFGDGPQRGWSSTAQHLLYVAGACDDSRAQWMARRMIEESDSSLGSQNWMMVTFYDPSVPEKSPAELPTAKLFPEIGQVMMRSAWNDTSAGMVGLKCGPFMGMTHSADAVFDWGTGHSEPDAGSFQLFSHGKFLAVGALYTGYKRSGDFNTMMFKGRGQLGGDMPAFGSIEALKFGHHPEIVHTEFTPEADYVVGDVARAYHPALGLKKYLRHWLYLKPDILLVADEVELDIKGTVVNFPPKDLEVGPGLVRNSAGQISGGEGEAYAVFDGTEGNYKLYASYLDNLPEENDYAIKVDGREVHAWKSHNQDIDDNLLEITPQVVLRPGSRIAFHGRGADESWRLTKMAAFSDKVETARSAQWLMHFEPQTEIRRQDGRLTVLTGGAALDHYLLSPATAKIDLEKYEILGADVEPFNYKTTKRLVVEPQFNGERLTMLTLLRMRGASDHPLSQPKSKTTDRGFQVSWLKDGKKVVVDWSLQNRNISINYE